MFTIAGIVVSIVFTACMTPEDRRPAEEWQEGVDMQGPATEYIVEGQEPEEEALPRRSVGEETDGW